MGRAFKRCLPLKFPVLLWTAAEATQIGYCVFLWSLFLANATDSSTNARLHQARFMSAPSSWRGVSGRRPLGDGRGRASGDGRGLGVLPRHISPNGGSGRLAGRMPASWRADCHATGGGVPPGTAGSSPRDSAAAGSRTRRCYLQ